MGILFDGGGGFILQRWQGGSSYSGELKLILMMHNGSSLQIKVFF